MIISALTVNGITTLEIKHNNSYVVVSGKTNGFPYRLLLKGIIQLHKNKKAKSPQLRRTKIFPITTKQEVIYETTKQK